MLLHFMISFGGNHLCFYHFGWWEQNVLTPTPVITTVKFPSLHSAAGLIWWTLVPVCDTLDTGRNLVPAENNTHLTDILLMTETRENWLDPRDGKMWKDIFTYRAREGDTGLDTYEWLWPGCTSVRPGQAGQYEVPVLVTVPTPSLSHTGHTTPGSHWPDRLTFVFQLSWWSVTHLSLTSPWLSSQTTSDHTLNNNKTLKFGPH